MPFTRRSGWDLSAQRCVSQSTGSHDPPAGNIPSPDRVVAALRIVESVAGACAFGFRLRCPLLTVMTPRGACPTFSGFPGGAQQVADAGEDAASQSRLIDVLLRNRRPERSR
jgi:hypothetical protein